MEKTMTEMAAERRSENGGIRYGLAVLILWSLVVYAVFGDKPAPARVRPLFAAADCQAVCLK